MSYKSENIKIEGTANDRRAKLTQEDRILIKRLREEEGISLNKLAAQFKVSKRLIQFICDPEKLEENKKRRLERGGWVQYYDKEKGTKAVRETRAYKKQLFKNGIIGKKDKPL